MMTVDDAIATLTRYNQWRTGEDERTMDEAGIVPAKITEAINRVALWYESPEPYALELIRRMLTRLHECGHYKSVCDDAKRYLEHNTK